MNKRYLDMIAFKLALTKAEKAKKGHDQPSLIKMCQQWQKFEKKTKIKQSSVMDWVNSVINTGEFFWEDKQSSVREIFPYCYRQNL